MPCHPDRVRRNYIEPYACMWCKLPMRQHTIREEYGDTVADCPPGARPVQTMPDGGYGEFDIIDTRQKD